MTLVEIQEVLIVKELQMDEEMIPQEVSTLQEHETASAVRAAHIEQEVKQLEKEIEMTTPDVNIYQKDGLGSVLPMLMGNAGGGTGAAVGGGLGAGLLGGILGGVLLNRNGVLGGGAEGGVVTPTQLTAALAGVTDTLNNSTVLQTLGDIKAAIPYNEAQVQLALAGAQADINNNISNHSTNIITGQAMINKNISDAIASSLSANSAVKETVASYGVANLTATQNAQHAIISAIRDESDKNRALLIAQNDATLNRQLTVAEGALAEQRAVQRSRDVEINVTQNVNQNQVQSQQQQQLQVLSNALAVLANQQQHISQGIVNLGTMSGSSGQQTAANTKVH